MWAVFLAVTKDLGHFVCEVFGFKTNNIASFGTSDTKNQSSFDYIVFRLNAAGIQSPVTIFSDGGFLHELLRGQPGVRINITPREHAIMEVFDTDHQSQLLFVERVESNDDLTVSSVGWKKDGEFRLDTFQKPQWQEWRPIFINFEIT